ncbi:MAG: hypothetical protein AVDCRST_MAG32-1734, partial [uncultured Nocardioides sp.]
GQEGQEEGQEVGGACLRPGVRGDRREAPEEEVLRLGAQVQPVPAADAQGGHAPRGLYGAQAQARQDQEAQAGQKARGL